MYINVGRIMLYLILVFIPMTSFSYPIALAKTSKNIYIKQRWLMVGLSAFFSI